MSKTNEARLDSLFQKLSVDLANSNKRDNPAVQRLALRMRKRAMYNRPELDDAGFAQFLDTNEKVGNFSVRLDQQLVRDAQYFIETILWRYNSTLDDSNIQEHMDINHLFDLWRFGPGASNEVSGTHCAEKIEQAMTCTQSAEDLVVNLRSRSPYFSAFDALNGMGTSLVEGSKLTTVPKNEETVRIIAIEPSGNMALQLAAGQYLTNVLKHIGLDISKQQPINKAYAHRGSIDGSLATIDLKSASDMISPELIRILFPRKWYDLLMKVRSDYTTIKGVKVKLNMISTMGNGFTFPLMTLCIVALIYAFRAQRNGPTLYVSWEDTAVFGDDIIVPVTEYVDFCCVLQDAGFVVNTDKSYYTGPFRESCGGDYYEGVDITPFYVRSLESDSDIYVVINQVLSWVIKHKVLTHQTLAFLATLIKDPLFVPEWSNPDQGILTQQVESRYKFLQPKAIHKKIDVNHFFLMPLAVGGYVFSHGPDVCYTPRQFKTRYVVRRGRLPKGYLSGYDPRKWTESDSAFSASLSSLFFRSTSSLN